MWHLLESIDDLSHIGFSRTYFLEYMILKSFTNGEKYEHLGTSQHQGSG